MLDARNSATPSTSTCLLAAAALLAAAGCGATQRPDGGEGLLRAGDRVPDLTARDHRGADVTLRNSVVSVIYFYPRDGTPGCTREACAFRDAFERYAAAGVRVVGVSTDSVESHREFAEEHGLPFSLVADPERTWARAFGVNLTLGMTERVSFLVDTTGRVAKVYPDVDPGVHADQVLSDAAQLHLTPPQ